jgi:phage protein D
MLSPEVQNRRSSSFSVSYPDFPSINILPRSVTIYQDMGMHDRVEVRYRNIPVAIFNSLKTGVPIEIFWKNDKASGKIYGYVTEVVTPVRQRQYREVKVRCVGASYPLKERGSKIWTNKTASEIATEIAKKTKLKPIVTPHTTRFTQQSLAGQSYWEKLRELASLIGYGVQVSGTELHFHPIDKMINQFMTVMPVMAIKNQLTSPSNYFNAPTLDVFEPRLGDYNESVEHLRTENIVSGVDPITGKVYTSKTSPNKLGKPLRQKTKDPLFFQKKTNTVVNSSSMAKSLSEAASQLGRFAIVAPGTGQGDPRVAPWRTMEVRGTGDNSDGFWVIQKVEHYIHADGRYQVEFTCLSDGIGGNKASAFRPSAAGNVPYRNIVNDMVTNPKGRPTSTKLGVKAPLISQGSAGYKVNPRRWIGN